MTPLISIIVPVYQVRTYICECLEALLYQTYTNLEIILVDDGSTDGSGEICDKYACMDGRIRVIHQENGGPSAARNAGLDCFYGEYIAFVDGDDVVSPVYIEKLYHLIEKYHADISVCAYGRGDVRSQSKEDHDIREICMDSKQMLRQWHGRLKKYETVVWNKLYHASVFNGGQGKHSIRYPAFKRDEDIVISHLIIQNAKRVAITASVLYWYRNRPDSLTAKNVMLEHMGQNLSAQRERMTFFRKQGYWRAYCNLMTGYLLHVGWFGWKAVAGGRRKV